MPIGNLEVLSNQESIHVEVGKDGEPSSATCTCGEFIADDDLHRVMVWAKQHEWQSGHLLVMGET